MASVGLSKRQLSTSFGTPLWRDVCSSFKVHLCGGEPWLHGSTQKPDCHRPIMPEGISGPPTVKLGFVFHVWSSTWPSRICQSFRVLEKPETWEHQQAEMKKPQGEQERGRQPIRTDANSCFTPYKVSRSPAPVSEAHGEPDPYPIQCQRGGAPVSPLAGRQQRRTETR